MLVWQNGDAEGSRRFQNTSPLSVSGEGGWKCHAYMTSHFWHSDVGTCWMPALGWMVMATVLVPGLMGLILQTKTLMVATYLRHRLDRGRPKVGGRDANLAQKDPERL